MRLSSAILELRKKKKGKMSKLLSLNILANAIIMFNEFELNQSHFIILGFDYK